MWSEKALEIFEGRGFIGFKGQGQRQRSQWRQWFASEDQLVCHCILLPSTVSLNSRISIHQWTIFLWLTTSWSLLAIV